MMVLPPCRFPAQERVGGASKIPTIIYYDDEGKVRAVGSEAAAVEQTAEDEGWTRAEWYSSLPWSLQCPLNEM